MIRLIIRERKEDSILIWAVQEKKKKILKGSPKILPTFEDTGNGGSGWGTRVYLWWIHVDIWQNQYNIVKLKNKIIIIKKERILSYPRQKKKRK